MYNVWRFSNTVRNSLDPGGYGWDVIPCAAMSGHIVMFKFTARGLDLLQGNIPEDTGVAV
uniref:Uncharacterized protein n=1 Tax=uncultured bacterium 246 TaxID=698384 RepID=E3T6D8_9BACT|nr:hypothetical protein [uncultured bacterium 246]